MDEEDVTNNPTPGYSFVSKQFPTAAQQREHQGR